MRSAVQHRQPVAERECSREKSSRCPGGRCHSGRSSHFLTLRRWWSADRAESIRLPCVRSHLSTRSPKPPSSQSPGKGLSLGLAHVHSDCCECRRTSVKPKLAARSPTGVGPLSWIVTAREPTLPPTRHPKSVSVFSLYGTVPLPGTETPRPCRTEGITDQISGNASYGTPPQPSHQPRSYIR
jgi:hypothetical protein